MNCLYVGQPENFGYGKEVLDARGDTLETTGSIVHISDTVNRILSPDPRQYGLVIYDLSMFVDPPEVIVDVVQRTQNTNQAAVILTAPGKGQDTELIAAFLKAGFFNFVLDATYGRQKESFEQCLNGYFEANRKEIRNLLPTEDARAELHYIAFTGTQGRIGTTTQAVQYTGWLVSMGCRACYVEQNGAGYPEQILCMYQSARKMEGHTVYQGIPMYSALSLQEMSKMPYDYFVLDMGAMDASGFDTRLFLSEQVRRVIVAGAKPQELPHTFRALESAQYADAYYIFSFVPDGDVEEVRRMTADRKERVGITGYMPDPFDFGMPGSGDGYGRILPVRPQGGKRLPLFGRKRRRNTGEHRIGQKKKGGRTR